MVQGIPGKDAMKLHLTERVFGHVRNLQPGLQMIFCQLSLGDCNAIFGNIASVDLIPKGCQEQDMPSGPAAKSQNLSLSPGKTSSTLPGKFVDLRLRHNRYVFSSRNNSFHVAISFSPLS